MTKAKADVKEEKATEKDPVVKEEKVVAKAPAVKVEKAVVKAGPKIMDRKFNLSVGYESTRLGKFEIAGVMWAPKEVKYSLPEILTDSKKFKNAVKEGYLVEC